MLRISSSYFSLIDGYFLLQSIQLLLHAHRSWKEDRIFEEDMHVQIMFEGFEFFVENLHRCAGIFRRNIVMQKAANMLQLSSDSFMFFAQNSDRRSDTGKIRMGRIAMNCIALGNFFNEWKKNFFFFRHVLREFFGIEIK